MKSSLARGLLCIALLCLVAPSPALPQERPGAFRLSLAECLRTALANNLDLVAARTDPQIAEQVVVQNDAAFDFSLDAGYTHSEQKQLPRQLSSPTSFKGDSATVNATQVLPFGPNYRVGFFANRQELVGGFSTSDISYVSGLDTQITVPLLRGRGREVTTERLVLSKGDLEISHEALRVAAHRVAQTVEGAYWDVVASIEALRTARLALERADDLLALNRKKVEVGTLAPIEITQAEAGVASQQEGVIVAETLVADAEDNLRRLMAVPEDDPLWNAPLQPTDRPSFARVEIDLEQALATAYESRPELAQARLDLRNRELGQRVARANLRHQLDAVAAYKPFASEFDGGLSSSVSSIPDFKEYNWSIGLQYAYPIGNRAAEATDRIATLNRDRADVQVRSAEQNVRVEVRQAVRGVDSGIKRVEAARKNVDLQREKLEAEQKKFENGMSTSFEVLTFQNDLSSAELALIRAGLDYAKAMTEVERAKGTLLEARGLSLDAP